MKLRNKRTGDIWEFDGGFSMKATQETAEKVGAESGSLTCFESSIAELNEEWEDYEEPKNLWEIDSYGKIQELKEPADSIFNPYWKKRKEIGNYFETKEEAEKAVEKLKAWKRLTDKGFRFTGCVFDNYIRFELPYMEWDKNISDDIKLLFGGEE